MKSYSTFKMVMSTYIYIYTCNHLVYIYIVEVALELLSFDSIDESVRRLVVQRLESLSNDEVLLYLLQLVQVCI